MATRRSVVVGVSLALTLAWSSPAWATFNNFKSFKETYPGKTYSCKICHQEAIGRKDNLNAYGLALQKSKAPGDAKHLTADDYHAVEKDDADGDGASNIDEINAGTAPGDPASVPVEAAPKPAQDTSAPATSSTSQPHEDTKP